MGGESRSSTVITEQNGTIKERLMVGSIKTVIAGKNETMNE
jgi:hypothetical protein